MLSFSPVIYLFPRRNLTVNQCFQDISKYGKIVMLPIYTFFMEINACMCACVIWGEVVG